MGGKNNVKGHVAEKPSGGLPPGTRDDQIKNLIGNAEYVAARIDVYKRQPFVSL